MSESVPDHSWPPALEEALFQRLLQRMIEGGFVPKIPLGGLRTTTARNSAIVDATEQSTGPSTDLLADIATDPSSYLERHGIEGLSALPLLDHPNVSKALTVVAAQKIVDRRRDRGEPIAQVLFRVPDHLRDDVKRLSLSEKRQMDELLTEAVLDLLLKHEQMPTAFQKR